MVKRTLVYPTSRAIRHELLTLENSLQFLPDYITVSEFLQRVCIVKGLKRIDDDTRTLMLLEASDFKEFEHLQIERNFFTFTQNSSYIFSLFSELATEKVELQELELADTYGDYEEHIAILKVLLERYEKLCRENSFYDPIFLPKTYEFNETYVTSLGEIKIVVEGYLSTFEMEILQRSASVSSLHVELATTSFNKKMLNSFAKLGFELESGYDYLLDMTNIKILEQKKREQISKITCQGFSEDMLQVAFVKQKVYEYLQNGMRPEDIVVVLPSESFAQSIKLYDDEDNFNFAMGETYTKSESYRHLSAVSEYIQNPTVENAARLKEFGGELYEHLFSIFHAKVYESVFFDILVKYSESIQNRDEKKIFDEELYGFTKIKNFIADFSVKSVLHLFMQRLSKRSIDDVRGGKITVMGVLESRYTHYKGVIIPDFSDDNVPRRSEKDLFLNSDIRSKAKLPTQLDRENLQKHYYTLLIQRAEHVSISYTDSLTSGASRFLTQLGIEAKSGADEKEYAKILHTQGDASQAHEEIIECEYDFSKVRLSATALKKFLECKRKYYNSYILRLDAHEIPSDFPTEQQIGRDLHEALHLVYETKQSFSDAKELHNRLYKALETQSGQSSFEQYQLKLWEKKLGSFVKTELERFSDGYKVYATERSLECEFAGFRLAGQIDRIDEKEGSFYVLDYKSGKYPQYTAKTVGKATDFQLEFYYLLTSTLGQVDGCGYYDLNNGTIVHENLLEEKLALLKETLEALKEQKSFNFEKTDDTSRCKYCEFIYLCGRA